MNTPLAPQPYGVVLKNVGYSYGKHEALTGINADITPGKITGLLGRNGSGKSTLEMAMAGQLRTSGTVGVAGENVWENEDRMAHIALVSDSTSVYMDSRPTSTIDLWEAVRPTFRRDVVESLLDAWEIPLKKAPEKLSRGQLSAFYAALGIGSRAPLTMFDEVHLGMDAVLRRDFYDVLLQDFIAYPRTIIISSHNVEEIEDLIEDVLIIENGRVAEAGSADDVRAAHSREGRIASLTDVLADITHRRSGTDALRGLTGDHSASTTSQDDANGVVSKGRDLR